MTPTNPRTPESQYRTRGIPCPICGQLIPISIQQLLSGGNLRCPICGLNLSVDKNKSDKALKMLAKVDEAQRRVESRRSNSINNNHVNDEEIANALKEIVLAPEE